MSDPPKAPPPRRPNTVIGARVDMYKGLAGYGTIGMEVVLSIFVGFFGGNWLDNKYGTGPWLMLVGSALGVTVAIKALIRVARMMRKHAEEEERLHGNPMPLYESTSERAERKKRGEKGNDDPVVADDGVTLLRASGKGKATKKEEVEPPAEDDEKPESSN